MLLIFLENMILGPLILFFTGRDTLASIGVVGAIKSGGRKSMCKYIFKLSSKRIPMNIFNISIFK